MVPSKAGKTLIEYNCKNGVYSVDGGVTIKPLGYLSAITLDKSISTNDIYGDGELQLSLISDKGSTGTLEMTARDEAFEKDLGFSMDIAQGVAEVQVIENKKVDIGFECYITGSDGITKTKKIWLLNINVSPASDSLSQNTDTTNQSAASYGLTVKGVNLKNSTGTSDYTDANGNTKKVFKVRSLPLDSGYNTFLDSVPTPRIKTEVNVSVVKDENTSAVTIVNQYGETITNKAYVGDVLTISATFNEGYEVNTFTVNSQTFVSGSTHNVEDDVSVNVTSKQIEE